MAADPLLTNTGVDVYSTIYMRYPQGRVAVVTNTIMNETGNKCIIYGTHGRVEIDNINNPMYIQVFGPDNKPREEMRPQNKEYNGYEYQFKAVRKAAIANKLETDEYPRIHMKELYRLTDSLRYTWNIMFPLPGEPEKRKGPQPQGPQGEQTPSGAPKEDA